MFLPLNPLLSELSKIKQTLLKTKRLHALILKSHLSHDPFYATRLIRFYANNNDLHSARYLFDKTPQRTVYLWNSVIRAYAKSHRFDQALCLFKTMLESETRPDGFTYACVIRMCVESFGLSMLRCAHQGVVVSGLGNDPTSSSALVTAYAKLGCFDDASRVFWRIDDQDLVLWNTMISGCGYCGLWDKGMELFQVMRGRGIWPDGYTFVGLISSLVSPRLIGVGQGVHGLCLKSGFEVSDHIGSALVSMYSRMGCVDLAYREFSSLVLPDLVTLSALITGYSQSGDSAKALYLFSEMNFDGKKADPVLIASVLAAAAQSVHVGGGSEIHSHVLRHGLESDIRVSSALVDMYSKCGFLKLGIRVFETMPKRNIVSYNSLILGFGLHGLAFKAFNLFKELNEKGLKPDESTFSALLCACRHAGLVQDGWDIFKRMTDEFHIHATTEHYVHMVKLLGMAGKSEEAYSLIQPLTEPVDSGVWGALLSCCHIQGNLHLAETLAQRLFQNEPEKASYRVMLSNLHASDGRWDDVERLRSGSAEGNLSKVPGLSWVSGIGY